MMAGRRQLRRSRAAPVGVVCVSISALDVRATDLWRRPVEREVVGVLVAAARWNSIPIRRPLSRDDATGDRASTVRAKGRLSPTETNG